MPFEYFLNDLEKALSPLFTDDFKEVFNDVLCLRHDVIMNVQKLYERIL